MPMVTFFRIWVADDRRPGIEIELESRSQGFQWFFSFYLVFLVESEEIHKEAVLLLDEPGLHLHPTAQQ
jgi:predicted ATP-dependent endonuclease of OLD family